MKNSRKIPEEAELKQTHTLVMGFIFRKVVTFASVLVLSITGLNLL